jgi:hypothetical protein
MLYGIFHRRNLKSDSENVVALKPDVLGIYSRYGDSGRGSNKIQQLFTNLCKIPEYLHRMGIISLSERYVTCLRNGVENFSSAMSVSIITKWPTSINIFKTAVLNYQKTSPKDEDRKDENLTRAIREGTECMGADTFRFLGFLTASKILMVSSMLLKGFGLSGCIFSLCIDSLDTRLSCREIQKAEAKKAFTDVEKNDQKQKVFYENLNIIKKVAGVACTVFVIVSLLAGIPFTGAILLFGTTSIILTIAAEFYKNSMQQTLVKEAKVAAVLV